jgi:HEAT repeat protein
MRLLVQVRVATVVMVMMGAALGCRQERPQPEPDYGRVYAAAVQAARQATPGQAARLLPDLVARLGIADPSGWLHRACIEALGKTHDVRTIAPLNRVISAPPHSVEFFQRRLAARGLGQVGSREVPPLLVRALVRQEGPLSLEPDAAAGLITQGAAALPALEAALGDADPALVAAAARTLGKLGHREAAAALNKALAAPRAVGPARQAIEDALQTLRPIPAASPAGRSTNGLPSGQSIK